MPHHEHATPEPPYWSEQIALGRVELSGETWPLYLQLHHAEERYHGRESLLRLSRPTGTRRYYQARPYVIVPEITLTVGVMPEVSHPAQLGRVEGVEIAGVRRHVVGEAQAWYYPADRLLLLWECYLFARYRQAEDPRADPATLTLWRGFERTLVERAPEAERIATTWEDEYDRDVWETFLAEQGYVPAQSGFFIKALR